MISSESSSTKLVSTEKPSITCPVCDKIIKRRADFPRHMKLHATGEDKEKLLHHCPFQGCTFKNLQKSNLKTHIRTHTQNKSQHCPDCGFSTCDPGSLTRHRKRIHDYEPKVHQKAFSGKAHTQKESVRVTPYTVGGRSSSGPSTSTLPSPSSASDKPYLELPTPSYPSSSTPPESYSCVLASPLPLKQELNFPITEPSPVRPSANKAADATSFGWDFFTTKDGVLRFCTSKSPTPELRRSPSPRQVSPAINTTFLEELDLIQYWATLRAASIGLSRSLELTPRLPTPVGPFNFQLETTAAPAASQPILPEFYNPWASPAQPTPAYPSQPQGIYSPIPQYATDLNGSDYPSEQKLWALDDYLNGTPAMGLPATETLSAASWDQLYAPPLPSADVFSYPVSYESISCPSSPSPSLSSSSDESARSSISSQEFDNFFRACSA